MASWQGNALEKNSLALAFAFGRITSSLLPSVPDPYMAFGSQLPSLPIIPCISKGKSSPSEAQRRGLSDERGATSNAMRP